MKLSILSLLSVTICLCSPVHAADEYTFDLNKPPAYAREWFTIAAQDKAARETGPVQEFNVKGLTDDWAAVPIKGFKVNGLSDIIRKLAPDSNASAEQWAAYRFAFQQCSLARLPNFQYLNGVRKSAVSNGEVLVRLSPWSHESLSHTPSSCVTRWALSPPSIDPRTKPEEVKKLNRYSARLAAQMLRQMNESFDPEYKEHFKYKHTFDRSGAPGAQKRTEKEIDALRLAWIEESWKDGMGRIHMLLESSIRFTKSGLCHLFRTHLPGDKESIREMLIEAGYKTAADRKAYWEFCRTQGAEWAGWEPADEARLVTE